jgi:Asp-tRNA(Asn)/Glu-tRNA(Gln) amidotransferase A subunit family amidase
MISLQIRNTTCFKKIENDISKLPKKDVKNFFTSFINSYLELDKLYSFNEFLIEDYIYEQIEKVQLNKELSFMPFGIKDIFNTRVLPTSMGSNIWKGFKAGNNARIVDKIMESGGIVFSKTTTAEFAVHFISPGKTLNPYNIKHITGTSSSGSAVAVACGALPISLGTQTAGSIIRPASFCGVYGFKPSFGSLDRTGVLKTNDTFDTIGFISADIYGIKKSFFSLFQKGNDYPYSKKYFSFFEKYKTIGKSKIKVGVLSNELNVLKGFKNYVSNDFESFLSIISVNYDIVELKNISFLNSIHPIHELMYSKSLSYYFQNEIKQNQQVSNVMLDMIRRGEDITSEDYVNSLKTQPILTKKFENIFENVDFIVVPSTASFAPEITQNEIDDTCLIWTFFGYPSITIPLFYDENNKLPYGLQIIAKKYEDFALLDFADKIENMFK